MNTMENLVNKLNIYILGMFKAEKFPIKCKAIEEEDEILALYN
jgi:hypothetical protein